MSEPEAQPTPEEREDEHWTVRRQKAVKCKRHGLYYDPRMTSGCALCRKEGGFAKERAKPQFLSLLLLLLAITLVIYGVFLPGFLNRETPEEVEAPVAEPLKLDPEKHRAAIEGVEEALYQPAAIDLVAMRGDIHSALEKLAGDLGASRYAVGREAAQEVAAFRAAIPEEALKLAVLERARSEWPRLRARYFSPAAWYFRTEAGEGEDHAALATYSQLAGDLLALVGEGSVQAEELASPAPSSYVDPGEQARKRQQWRSYKDSWRRRVGSLKAQLPPRPGIQASSDMLVATQKLEQAFVQALALADADLDAATSRFEATYDFTADAHRSFESLLTP